MSQVVSARGSISTHPSRMPVNNAMFKDLQCLHPLEQKSERRTSKMSRIAESVSQVVDKNQISHVTDEWKMYQLGNIPESSKFDDTGKDVRVDDYWNKVLQTKNSDSAPRYKVLGLLIKAVLCSAVLW